MAQTLSSRGIKRFNVVLRSGWESPGWTTTGRAKAASFQEEISRKMLNTSGYPQRCLHEQTGREFFDKNEASLRYYGVVRFKMQT